MEIIPVLNCNSDVICAVRSHSECDADVRWAPFPKGTNADWLWVFIGAIEPTPHLSPVPSRKAFLSGKGRVGLPSLRDIQFKFLACSTTRFQALYTNYHTMLRVKASFILLTHTPFLTVKFGLSCVTYARADEKMDAIQDFLCWISSFTSAMCVFITRTPVGLRVSWSGKMWIHMRATKSKTVGYLRRYSR